MSEKLLVSTSQTSMGLCQGYQEAICMIIKTTLLKVCDNKCFMNSCILLIDTNQNCIQRIFGSNKSSCFTPQKSFCSKWLLLRMKHHIPLFKWNDCVPHWQRVDGWRQMKRPLLLIRMERSWKGSISLWKLPHQKIASADVYFPLALWSTIIECSKREAQPTGFAWRWCHKTAFTARFEFKCNCRLLLLIGQSKTSSTNIDQFILVKLWYSTAFQQCILHIAS